MYIYLGLTGLNEVYNWINFIPMINKHSLSLKFVTFSDSYMFLGVIQIQEYGYCTFREKKSQRFPDNLNLYISPYDCDMTYHAW